MAPINEPRAAKYYLSMLLCWLSTGLFATLLNSTSSTSMHFLKISTACLIVRETESGTPSCLTRSMYMCYCFWYWTEIRLVRM